MHVATTYVMSVINLADMQRSGRAVQPSQGEPRVTYHFCPRQSLSALSASALRALITCLLWDSEM
eukprot:scaffold15166_cov140-Isochrysis_galbana.AAC.3